MNSIGANLMARTMILLAAIASAACLWAGLCPAGEEAAEVPLTKDVLDKIAGKKPGWAMMMIKEPPSSPEVGHHFEIAPVAHATFSPDGTQLIVWVRTPYAAIVPSFYDPQTLKYRGAIVDARYADWVACSQDGKTIAVASSSDYRAPIKDPLKIVRLGEEAKAIALDVDPHVVGRGKAMFGVDGKLYTFDSEVGLDVSKPPTPVITVWTLDWEGEKATKVDTIRLEKGSFEDFLISPDGKLFLIVEKQSGEEGGLSLAAYQLPDRKPLKELPLPTPVGEMVFSYDSSLLALLENLEAEPKVRVLKTADWSDYATVKSYALGAQPNVEFGGLAIAPKNNLLAFFNVTAKMVSLVSLPAGEPVTLLWAGKLLERPGGSLAFSPDGKELISAGVAVVTFDVSKFTAAE